jgi:hypothetical protein
MAFGAEGQTFGILMSLDFEAALQERILGLLVASDELAEVYLDTTWGYAYSTRFNTIPEYMKLCYTCASRSCS